MKKLYYLFFGVFALSGCEACNDKPLPAGIATHVYGTINDTENAIPVSNHKVKVGEYIGNFVYDGGMHYYFVQWVDSSSTDLNGNYDFIFKTSGKGSKYKLELEPIKDIWSFNSLYKNIDSIGKSFHADFEMLHLYQVKLKITLNNVDYLPIRLNFNSYNYSFIQNIENNNVEELREIYVNKNSSFTIKFYRTKPDGKNQIATFNFPATNSTNPVEIPITLNNFDFIDY